MGQFKRSPGLYFLIAVVGLISGCWGLIVAQQLWEGRDTSLSAKTVNPPNPLYVARQKREAQQKKLRERPVIVSQASQAAVRHLDAMKLVTTAEAAHVLGESLPPIRSEEVTPKPPFRSLYTFMGQHSLLEIRILPRANFQYAAHASPSQFTSKPVAGVGEKAILLVSPKLPGHHTFRRGKMQQRTVIDGQAYEARLRVMKKLVCFDLSLIHGGQAPTPAVINDLIALGRVAAQRLS